MDQIKKEDIKQEVFDLYDDYAHNRLDRRGFMEKLSFFAVGSLTVPALMSFLMQKTTHTLQENDYQPR
jgi:carboxymethylenebutenolidase